MTTPTKWAEYAAQVLRREQTRPAQGSILSACHPSRMAGVWEANRLVSPVEADTVMMLLGQTPPYVKSVTIGQTTWNRRNP